MKILGFKCSILMSALGVGAKKEERAFQSDSSEKFTYYMMCVSYEKKMNKRKSIIKRVHDNEPTKLVSFYNVNIVNDMQKIY